MNILTKRGRTSNQALICNPTLADGDFNVNGPFSDDPGTTRDGTFCQQTIPVGLWRTKTLRQIAETAPYFRDGQAATLDDVIDFYDRGGDPPGTFLGGPKDIAPLHLSAPEKQWLKALLETLTGDPVPPARKRDSPVSQERRTVAASVRSRSSVAVVAAAVSGASASTRRPGASATAPCRRRRRSAC